MCDLHFMLCVRVCVCVWGGGGGGALLGRFSNTVNVINCHGHGRTNFRPCVDRVFMTHPGCLTRHDAVVPVHVFLTMIFEFFHVSVLCTVATCVLCQERGANAKSDTVTIDVLRTRRH